MNTEHLRDLGLGKSHGDVPDPASINSATDINYLLPISRVLQGRTENFEKKSVFQRGFETFLSVFHPEL